MQTIQTVLQTKLQFAPVTVGELAVAFRHCIPIAVQRHLSCLAIAVNEAPVPSINVLALMIADQLEAPVALGSVEIEEQVGRFLRVKYAPRQASDPTTVLTLVPGARDFHRATLVLGRSHITDHWDDVSWYREAKRLAKNVLCELGKLQPGIQEAELVLQWITRVLAYGNRE